MDFNNQSTRNSLYSKAWAKWSELQYIMAIEECSELQKAITKHLRKQDDQKRIEDIKQEIADVEIMLEQLKLKFGEIGVQKYKVQKLERLVKMLED